jgi:pyruvate dehydrogenase (quinone)
MDDFDTGQNHAGTAIAPESEHRAGASLDRSVAVLGDAEQMGAAWDEALAVARRVVIEVKADPNIAPLPPHITRAQAKALASTLMKGDPSQGNVSVETAKQVLGAVLPRHHDQRHMQS